MAFQAKTKKKITGHSSYSVSTLRATETTETGVELHRSINIVSTRGLLYSYTTKLCYSSLSLVF